MSDIVERLRAVVERAWDWDYCYPGNLNIESLIIDLRKEAGEAAAEIERLREALVEARRAMQATISKFDACNISAVRNAPLGINGLRASLPKG